MTTTITPNTGTFTTHSPEDQVVSKEQAEVEHALVRLITLVVAKSENPADWHIGRTLLEKWKHEAVNP